MKHNVPKKLKIEYIFRKCQDKTSDIFLSFLLISVKVTHSERLSSFIRSLIEKKTQRLQQEIIRKKWDLSELEQVKKSFHDQ